MGAVAIAQERSNCVSGNEGFVEQMKLATTHLAIETTVNAATYKLAVFSLRCA